MNGGVQAVHLAFCGTPPQTNLMDGDCTTAARAPAPVPIKYYCLKFCFSDSLLFSSAVVVCLLPAAGVVLFPPVPLTKSVSQRHTAPSILINLINICSLPQ